MNQYGYALLGLTAIGALLLGVLAFAVLKLVMGARRGQSRPQTGGGETMLLSSALQDVMSRLQAQERAMSARVVASEQLSGQIVDGITAGLLVVDRSGRVEILNPAGRRMLEAPADAVGSEYREVLAGAAPLRDAILECLTTGNAIVRRSMEISGPGRMLHFGVTVSPLETPEGRGAICLFADLTNVVELEEQLRLKEALARVGELTAGIAHEFRNGLATIHGYSRLLVPDALPPQYRPYLEGIRQETDALGQIVTNFLSFARPETMSLTAVSVEPLARRASEELRHELPEDTTINVRGEFGQIQGDEVLLRQVFANLVRNAAEACQGARIIPLIEIEGSVDRKRGTCRVSVRDNGPGIPQSARERVFQPFFTTRSRGTGLGLAIVQKIVVTHNGRVTAGTSRLGGASIEMVFPLG
jgi:signal transduction histidine kinase